MSSEKFVNGVVSAADRKEDNKAGWGKYKVLIQGQTDPYEVSVPPEIKEHELKPGLEISLKKSVYDWILLSNSPFLTGGTTASKQDHQPSESKSNGQPKYSDWNDYQINSRDPKLEYQKYLEICANVHIAVITSGQVIDPDDVISRIFKKADEVYAYKQGGV